MKEIKTASDTTTRLTGSAPGSAGAPVQLQQSQLVDLVSFPWGWILQFNGISAEGLPTTPVKIKNEKFSQEHLFLMAKLTSINESREMRLILYSAKKTTFFAKVCNTHFQDVNSNSGFV